MQELVVRGAQIVTMDPEVPDLARGDIVIRDGAIVSVEPRSQISGQAEAIEASGMIALPGFVDTHWHLWNTVMRGVVADDPARGYMAQKTALGPLFTEDDIYRSARLALLEAVSGGVTTVHDWAHNITRSGHADAEVAALTDAGVRARLSYGAPSTAQGLSLVEMAEVMASIMPVDRVMDYADVERVANSVRGRPDRLLNIGVALRGPARSTPDVYRQEWSMARELKLPIAMHCAGTRREVDLIRQVEVLASEKLLGPDVVLAHCIYLTTSEMTELGRHGVGVTISPLGELRGGSRPAPIRELREAGVNIALSFDSTSMTSADMFALMRITLDVENARQEDPNAITPRRVLEMATILGARLMGLEAVTGSITPGKRADIILVRSDDVNLAPLGDVESAIVHGGQPTNVDTVIIDGKVAKRRGEVVGVDPASIIQGASQAFHELLRRAIG